MCTYRHLMWSGLAGLVLSLPISSIGASTSPAQAAPASQDAIVDVTQRYDRFSPANITIPAGTTVRWSNGDDDAHTTTSDVGVWDSGNMNPGANFSYTFSSPGTYPYHCTIHRSMGMVGRIIVTGGGGQPGPAPVPGANLALGKPVRASSAQAGHPAQNAVDGNLFTFWASDPSVNYPKVGADLDAAPGTPAAYNLQWIYVDFGRTSTVGRMHMVWNGGNFARVYSVYVYSASCGGWCRIGTTNTGDGDDTLALSRPVSGRTFMLYLNYPAAPSGAYELSEWEVFGSQNVPPPSTNVALGRPARASSEQLPYTAGRVTDGNLDTDWRSAGLPAWVFVDFGSLTPVNRAVLRMSPGMHASRLALYAWTGYGWQGIYAANSAGGDHTAQFRTLATRYLLFFADNGPAGQVGLREFEVYSASGDGGSPYPYGIQEGEWGVQPDEAQPDVVPDGIAPDAIEPEAAPSDFGDAAELTEGSTSEGALDLLETLPLSLPDPRETSMD